jgi:iron-sulfur cluster assembly accessory protein
MTYEKGGPAPGDFVRTEHGATLDFKSELMSQRFVWTNPNAKSSCGCGESFAI